MQRLRRLPLFWALCLPFLAQSAPAKGPALEVSLSQPQPEPPGPSSRRSGMTISEVHYHPAPRDDGRELEFVELFNALPWFEDLSGWRLSGAVNYTFPNNTVLAARSYLVIAASPADLKAVTGLADNVFGPFDSGETLPDGSGKLRLWNKNGGVCFEMEYRDDGNWPVAADGGGHSLVLARPTLGERNPMAWAASAALGGSPGTAEPARDNALRSVLFNEIRAHTVPPDLDLVELYNYSEAPVSLDGWVITDDPTTNKFVLPAHTAIAPRGFISFDETQLGFRLNAAGERLFLRSADGRVIDALRYGPQETGVSYGRFPDGSPLFSRLQSSTPGAPNSPRRLPRVVINELMYHPPSDDDADEFIEVFNPGSSAVDLSGWRLEDGVSFTFPDGTFLPAGAYRIVGRDRERLKSNYPGLRPERILGDYQGTLANGGERVALSMPDWIVQTDKSGRAVSNLVHIVVDEVTYGTGGRWGRWSDGGGSSLERRDPRADGRLAASWADSDESAKSPWVTVEHTGRLDHGNTGANTLQVLSFGAGEFLLDNVEATPSGSTNRVLNSTFESGTNTWAFQGNHGASSLETAEADQGSRSLHVRTTGAGNTGANRAYARLAPSLLPNQTATLRARVRWLKGSPNILLRLHGSWLEAPGQILATKNLGSPGARNTAAVPNASPAITDVSHFPVVPSVTQPIRVLAQITDPDGLSNATLRWRRDTTAALTDTPMVDHGAGWFSATIPAQPTGALVAFHIVAEDGAATPVTARFPDNAPVRECLVRWGEGAGNIPLGPYRIWATRDTINRWTRREKLSNDPLDSTFVCGNYRVIYNAGSQYSGSPFHAPSYSTPTGSNCDYVTTLPPDDSFLGEQELNLLQPGNGGGDATCQQEQHAYWIARELGLPYSHRRPVQLFVNGVRRGTVYEDAQQPNSDYIAQWFPDDTDGDLHKIQLWFEFEADASSFTQIGADLGRYLTTGNVKKLARYRWTWPRRAYGNTPNDYASLFSLVDTVNTNVSGDRYARTLLHAVDVDNWFRTHVTEHIVGNSDSYSYGGGQNMYAYKPSKGPWQLMIWDIDFAFAAQGPTSDMVGIGGANVGPRNDVAPFNRMYYQAMIDAVQGPLAAERSSPIIDSRYNGMRTNGGSVSSGAPIKTFVSQRRNYILGLIKANTAPLKLTSNGGVDYSTDSGVAVLTGTAPLEVSQILANGIPLQLTWTTRTAWTARFPLANGVNALTLAGVDFHGRPITNDPVTLKITSTATPDSPVGNVVFNEVMHHPAQSGAGFIELRNLSSTTAYDLSDWRIDGVGFRFPRGAMIEAGGYVVVAQDDFVFAETYGPTLRLSGIYPGRLSQYGETLRLIRPGPDAASEVEIDHFTYRTNPPWPAAANTGSSLQLIDAAQDNNRPGNWTAATTNASATAWQRVVATGTASSSTLYIYLENAGDVYLDDLKLVAGSDPEGGPNLLAGGEFEGDFPGAFTVSPNLADSRRVTTVHHSGSAALHVVASAAGSTRASSIFQDLAPSLASGETYTLSFWFLPGGSTGALTVRLSGSGIRASAEINPSAPPPSLARFTPGAANNVAAALAPFPSVWLNEIQPVNLTGITDPAGRRGAWVELYNGGPARISLADLYLGDRPDSPAQWRFPAAAQLEPGQFQIVWLDGEAGRTTSTDWHSSVRADPDNGMLLLAQVAGGRTTVLDSILYSPPVGERTFGDLPDGDPSARHLLGQATPRGPNTLALPPYHLFINEWMSDNAGTLRDPADQDFEDWFELYNAGPVAVDLTGFFLSDSRTNASPFEIPPGYVLPAQGRLLVWADGEASQNQPDRADLHVDFKLSSSGESIVLLAPDGTVVDAVDFSAQNPNVSHGRVPDGFATIVEQWVPTPRGANPPPAPELVGFTSDPIARTFSLSWTSVPGRRYVVERFDSSVVGDPLDASAVITANASVSQFQESISEQASAYYRIRQLP